jgi:hypothetical protein
MSLSTSISITVSNNDLLHLRLYLRNTVGKCDRENEEWKNELRGNYYDKEKSFNERYNNTKRG